MGLQTEEEKSAAGQADAPQPEPIQASDEDDSSISSPVDMEKKSTPQCRNVLLQIFGRSQQPPDEVGPPPDGGLQAWTQAVMGTLVCINSWGFIQSFGIFQLYYETELLPDSSPSAISWIGSVQTFLLFAIGTWSGRVLDAGYFRLIYTSGVVFQLLGVFTMSVAKTYWQLFLAQGVCIGVGNGLLFCPATALVSTWFSKKRTFALALGLIGTGIGGMIFPAMIERLLPQIGFGWTVRVLGFFILALSCVTIALFRTRLPPRTTGPTIDWSAFRDAPFMLYVAGFFCIFLGLFFAFFYVSEFARDSIHLPDGPAFDILIVNNGVGILGRLCTATISDMKTGPLNVIIPAAAITAVTSYCWAAVESEGGLYAWTVVYGLVASGVQGLWPGGLASLTEDSSKIGSRMGTAFTIASIGALIGPSIGGALVSADNGKFLYAQMYGGSCFMLGVICVACARVAKVGLKLHRV